MKTERVRFHHCRLLAPCSAPPLPPAVQGAGLEAALRTCLLALRAETARPGKGRKPFPQVARDRPGPWQPGARTPPLCLIRAARGGWEQHTEPALVTILSPRAKPQELQRSAVGGAPETGDRARRQLAHPVLAVQPEEATKTPISEKEFPKLEKALS